MKITIVQGAFFPVPPLLGGAVGKRRVQLREVFAAKGQVECLIWNFLADCFNLIMNYLAYMLTIIRSWFSFVS